MNKIERIVNNPDLNISDDNLDKEEPKKLRYLATITSGDSTDRIDKNWNSTA